jgi:hypothetical protein
MSHQYYPSFPQAVTLTFLVEKTEKAPKLKRKRAARIAKQEPSDKPTLSLKVMIIINTLKCNSSQSKGCTPASNDNSRFEVNLGQRNHNSGTGEYFIEVSVDFIFSDLGTHH